MLFSSFKSRKQDFLVFGTAFLLLLIPLTTFSINNLREGRSKASEERIIPLNLESKTVNGDGEVDVLDLSIILTNWNTTNLEADINSDGAVDVLDLSLVLSNWAT